MSASTAFSAIERMLKNCAPGFTVRLANHSRVIHFGGKVYPSLPKFDDIEHGHIRKMVRFLGIDVDCASKWLPRVIKVEKQEVVQQLAASAPNSPTKNPPHKKR